MRPGRPVPAHPSGTYAVNDRVMHDVETAPYGEHPSNLGAYLARRIGDMVGIPAFFVDPVCVDEMTDVAHYTGFADFRRLSQFHALNQKSIGRKAAAALGRPYEQVNLIVCHLGGGVSVAAHHHGRVVDVFNVKDEGSMGMDRAGGLPVNQLIDYCYSGRSKDQVKKTLGRRAGMFSYLGTTDFRVICAKVTEGDPQFVEAYQALVYQLAKDIGAMAAVLRFHVDAIAYTGGMAYEQFFCDDITAYVGGSPRCCASPARRRCAPWRRAPCGCSTARPSLWHTEHYSVHRRRPVTFGKGDGPPRRVSTS